MNHIKIALAFAMMALGSLSSLAFPSTRPFLGEIRFVTWPNIPSTDWVRCDGRSLRISDYSTLYVFIGFAYGGDLNSQTFKIPDLRGRTPVGQGQGPTLSVRSAGAQGGSETETISIDELARHSHEIQGLSQFGSTSATTDNFLASGAVAFKNISPNIPLDQSTLSSEGLGQSVENMSPFSVLYCLFAVDGILPGPLSTK